MVLVSFFFYYKSYKSHYMYINQDPVTLFFELAFYVTLRRT